MGSGPLRRRPIKLNGRRRTSGQTKRLRNAIHPVGGPLYPPVTAFLDAPLALIAAHTAYRVLQIFNLLLVFVAAAGARYLAARPRLVAGRGPRHHVFPGFAGSINLGQNATLTLTILVWGWAFAARGRPVLGGIIWGLLAFKPVWALAFFLVPLLSRRWRMCLAMVGTGIGFGLLTLAIRRRPKLARLVDRRQGGGGPVRRGSATGSSSAAISRACRAAG